MDDILGWSFLVMTFSFLSYFINRSKRTISLPPGPPADPIIGHLRKIPSTDAEIVFHEWAKQYGDVIHLNSLGRSIIILNSHRAAVDLLEKRGGLYSDRPDTIVYKMMGWDPNLALLPYGQRFRKQRKIFHSYFTQKACIQFQPIQLENVYILADGLMKNKSDFDYLLGRFTAATTMRIAYGHQIRSDNDEYIRIADDAGAGFRRGGTPGGTLVDLFPIRKQLYMHCPETYLQPMHPVKYFPLWFPGTHYANAAREWRWAVRKMYDYPYEAIQKQMSEGTVEFSFLATELEAAVGRTLTQEEIDDIKGIASIIYTGGAETTWSSLTAFFLAMILYPECQKRGQEEVDRIVGRNRLPTFEDRDSLPYVNCVVEEVQRWMPVIPLGVPHRSTDDDIYRGMFIPKGSLIFANAYGMSLDENTYTNPKEFDPARFLPKSEGGNGEPPFGAAFGFGRRICPGRHLAVASVYIAIATIFSTMHISKAKDESGRDITPGLERETGITSHLKPFPCNITLRSDKAGQLISEAVQSIG